MKVDLNVWLDYVFQLNVSQNSIWLSYHMRQDVFRIYEWSCLNFHHPNITLLDTWKSEIFIWMIRSNRVIEKDELQYIIYIRHMCVMIIKDASNIKFSILGFTSLSHQWFWWKLDLSKWNNDPGIMKKIVILKKCVMTHASCRLKMRQI